MKKSILYRIVRPIVTFITKVFLRAKIIGKENIKGDKVLLAGTHTNNLDCFMLMSSTKKSIHFLAKIELFRGIKSLFFKHMGLIPVDRSKRNPESVRLAKEYIEDKQLVCIFPEGTTEKGKGLLPFKKGAARIANEANARIVPFVIKGKYRLFSKDLSIEFLPPMKLSGDIEKDTENLRNIIEKKLGE